MSDLIENIIALKKTKLTQKQISDDFDVSQADISRKVVKEKLRDQRLENLPRFLA